MWRKHHQPQHASCVLLSHTSGCRICAGCSNRATFSLCDASMRSSFAVDCTEDDATIAGMSLATFWCRDWCGSCGESFREVHNLLLALWQAICAGIAACAARVASCVQPASTRARWACYNTVVGGSHLLWPVGGTLLLLQAPRQSGMHVGGLDQAPQLQAPAACADRASMPLTDTRGVCLPACLQTSQRASWLQLRARVSHAASNGGWL